MFPASPLPAALDAKDEPGGQRGSGQVQTPLWHPKEPWKIVLRHSR